MNSELHWLTSCALAAFALVPAGNPSGTHLTEDPHPHRYPDARPAAHWRLEAVDSGRVFLHGSGPGGCDALGARDAFIWKSRWTYYMHYDGAGEKGWLTCLATSRDLIHWKAHGPALALGDQGREDAGSASYGVTFHGHKRWHMFYLGTPNTSPPPDRVPSFPYLTMKAEALFPGGPWKKRYEITPFRPDSGTYYSVTASPGMILSEAGRYLMFFSASTDRPVLRTIGIARTDDLDGPWSIDREPILPATEQVENSSLYHQGDTWFLFTNHVGLEDKVEYTDAVWVYWTTELGHWQAEQKAVVLDGSNCRWSKKIIGLPSVVRRGNRLALIYDGYAGAGIPRGASSHMQRDIGLAWLDLPLHVNEGSRSAGSQEGIIRPGRLH
jgi:hypothetical protein